MQQPYVRMERGYFDFAGDSDAGMSGKHNEDNYAIFEDVQHLAGNGSQTPVYVALVADGIGGNAGGEVASQLAVDTFVQRFAQLRASPIGERLEVAAQYANRAIYTYGQDNPNILNMGTTLVAVAVIEDTLSMVHAGDSRAYLLRGGKIYQLSLDHSRIQDLVDNAHITLDEIEGRRDRHHITRFLGPLEEAEIDHQIIDIDGRTGDIRLPANRRTAPGNAIRLQPGDTILLCSDGLTDVVSDDQIAEIVNRRNPKQAVKELINRANRNGGPDNITAVMLRRIERAAPDAPTAVFVPPKAEERRSRNGLLLGLLVAVLLVAAAGLAVWQFGLGSGIPRATETAVAMANEMSVEDQTAATVAAAVVRMTDDALATRQAAADAQATANATETATSISSSTPTATATATASDTGAVGASTFGGTVPDIPSPMPTQTPEPPPTATPTRTPTATKTPTAMPPKTSTPVPPTDTPSPPPTPTSTNIPAAATPTQRGTPTPGVDTNTVQGAQPGSEAASLSVTPEITFYENDKPSGSENVTLRWKAKWPGGRMPENWKYKVEYVQQASDSYDDRCNKSPYERRFMEGNQEDNVKIEVKELARDTFCWWVLVLDDQGHEWRSPNSWSFSVNEGSSKDNVQPPQGEDVSSAK